MRDRLLEGMSSAQNKLWIQMSVANASGHWTHYQNIHTYTTGGFFQISRTRWGFFDLEIQSHGGTYDWNSEGMGVLKRG